MSERMPAGFRAWAMANDPPTKSHSTWVITRAEARAIVEWAERAEAALRRCADETYYCYLCDHHSNRGHNPDCPIARRSSDAERLDLRSTEKTSGLRPDQEAHDE